MWNALFLLVIGGGAVSAGAPGFAAADSTELALECRVTLEAHNAGPRAIEVVWDESHVRIRTGWWKQLGGDVGEARIAPGGEARWVYETDIGCAAERRWRFFLRRADGHEHMLYVPNDSFTASTTLNLGDVDRVF